MVINDYINEGEVVWDPRGEVGVGSEYHERRRRRKREKKLDDVNEEKEVEDDVREEVDGRQKVKWTTRGH